MDVFVTMAQKNSLASQQLSVHCIELRDSMNELVITQSTILKKSNSHIDTGEE